MSWTPRSERSSGLRPAYEGVPAHVAEAFVLWLGDVDVDDYYSVTFARTVALRVGISFGFYDASGPRLLQIALESHGPEKALDVVEGYLQTANARRVKELRNLLTIAGHTLTVGPDDKTLVDVVTPAMSTMATTAIQPIDRASAELQEAWNRAYGRGADASDAWDHAIKAVEALVGVIVEPANDKSTLGSQLGVIRNDSKSKTPKWSATCLKLQTGEGPHEAVLGLLGRIWVNPDRHGSGTPTNPTLAQSRAVVALAVSVVQMVREGSFLT